METRKNPGGISMDVVEERSASENISRFLSVMVDWEEQSKVSKSYVTVVTFELGEIEWKCNNAVWGHWKDSKNHRKGIKL